MTDRILDAIPHRPPFLFIDTIIEMDEKKIVAEKKLTPDLDFFEGHYPDFPVMPGVLTLESVFQAGAVLLSQHVDDMESGVPVLTRIKDAKFKKMVRPGDTLTLEARIEDSIKMVFYMKGSARVEGALVVSVSFTCALAPVGAV
ncbi:3-hydroxyacyl-[acyl-carrier-protein] dehydratase, FabZ form [hydrothermal vent metagenome]|uniref:3-hydroxyacyl-[acyl-carrier-protein] dehydratase, FabZ form n=1 Tax=hydrothermal vent metagenome TaxID=652676 RepID=A0A3B1BW71_9ZZZZ